MAHRRPVPAVLVVLLIISSCWCVERCEATADDGTQSQVEVPATVASLVLPLPTAPLTLIPPTVTTIASKASTSTSTTPAAPAPASVPASAPSSATGANERENIHRLQTSERGRAGAAAARRPADADDAVIDASPSDDGSGEPSQPVSISNTDGQQVETDGVIIRSRTGNEVVDHNGETDRIRGQQPIELLAHVQNASSESPEEPRQESTRLTELETEQKIFEARRVDPQKDKDELLANSVFLEYGNRNQIRRAATKMADVQSDRNEQTAPIALSTEHSLFDKEGARIQESRNASESFYVGHSLPQTAKDLRRTIHLTTAAPMHQETGGIHTPYLSGDAKPDEHNHMLHSRLNAAEEFPNNSTHDIINARKPPTNSISGLKTDNDITRASDRVSWTEDGLPAVSDPVRKASGTVDGAHVRSHAPWGRVRLPPRAIGHRPANADGRGSSRARDEHGSGPVGAGDVTHPTGEQARLTSRLTAPGTDRLSPHSRLDRDALPDSGSDSHQPGMTREDETSNELNSVGLPSNHKDDDKNIDIVHTNIDRLSSSKTPDHLQTRSFGARLPVFSIDDAAEKAANQEALEISSPATFPVGLNNSEAQADVFISSPLSTSQEHTVENQDTIFDITNISEATPHPVKTTLIDASAFELTDGTEISTAAKRDVYYTIDSALLPSSHLANSLTRQNLKRSEKVASVETTSQLHDALTERASSLSESRPPGSETRRMRLIVTPQMGSLTTASTAATAAATASPDTATAAPAAATTAAAAAADTTTTDATTAAAEEQTTDATTTTTTTAAAANTTDAAIATTSQAPDVASDVIHETNTSVSGVQSGTVKENVRDLNLVRDRVKAPEQVTSKPEADGIQEKYTVHSQETLPREKPYIAGRHAFNSAWFWSHGSGTEPLALEDHPPIPDTYSTSTVATTSVSPETSQSHVISTDNDSYTTESDVHPGDGLQPTSNSSSQPEESDSVDVIQPGTEKPEEMAPAMQYETNKGYQLPSQTMPEIETEYAKLSTSYIMEPSKDETNTDGGSPHNEGDLQREDEHLPSKESQPPSEEGLEIHPVDRYRYGPPRVAISSEPISGLYRAPLTVLRSQVYGEPANRYRPSLPGRAKSYHRHTSHPTGHYRHYHVSSQGGLHVSPHRETVYPLIRPIPRPPMSRYIPPVQEYDKSNGGEEGTQKMSDKPLNIVNRDIMKTTSERLSEVSDVMKAVNSITDDPYNMHEPEHDPSSLESGGLEMDSNHSTESRNVHKSPVENGDSLSYRPPKPPRHNSEVKNDADKKKKQDHLKIALYGDYKPVYVNVNHYVIPPKYGYYSHSGRYGTATLLNSRPFHHLEIADRIRRTSASPDSGSSNKVAPFYSYVTAHSQDGLDSSALLNSKHVSVKTGVVYNSEDKYVRKPFIRNYVAPPTGNDQRRILSEASEVTPVTDRLRRNIISSQSNLPLSSKSSATHSSQPNFSPSYKPGNHEPSQSSPVSSQSVDSHPSTNEEPSSDSTTSSAANQTVSNIMELLQTANASTLIQLLKLAELDTLLADTGPYTLFAPTNEAMDDLVKRIGGSQKMLEKMGKPNLVKLLLYHVMRGFTLMEDLGDNMLGRTLTGSRLKINQYRVTNTTNTTTTSGTNITTGDGSGGGGRQVITTINGARLVAGPHVCENGAVLWVSAVLAPPQPGVLAALQADPMRRFTVLLQALRLAGLYDRLRDDEGGALTVLAPTNAAFASVPEAELRRLLGDRRELRQLLLGHVITGALYSTGLASSGQVTSLTGERVTVTSDEEHLLVDGIRVVLPDISAENGVVHAIEGVIGRPRTSSGASSASSGAATSEASSVATSAASS